MKNIRNEEIWAYSGTGTKVHAFVGDASYEIHNRALCNKRITRTKGSLFESLKVKQRRVSPICSSCLKKAEEMWDRAEASMQAVNPYDQVCEGVVTEEGAARVAEDKPKPVPADMNRELLRQAQIVAEVTRELFPKSVRTVSQLPDELAVLDALNGQVVMDALHAEAIEMDAVETAKAAGVEIGRTYRPKLGAAIRHNPERIVTVCSIRAHERDTWVGYTIWEPGYQGSSGNWGSSTTLAGFLRMYEPTANTTEKE